MRSLILSLVLVIGTVSCGSKDSPKPLSPLDKLQGEYGLDLGYDCVFIIAIKNSNYSRGIACATYYAGSTVYMDTVIETGKLKDVTDSSITFVPEKSTCEDKEIETINYSLNDNHLALIEDTGIVILNKIPKQESDVTIISTNGCYTDNGFEERTLNLTELIKRYGN